MAKKTEKCRFEIVLPYKKNRYRFEMQKNAKTVSGMTVTSYPDGGYVRFSSSLCNFMNNPSEIRMFLSSDYEKIVIVPAETRNNETWSLVHQAKDGKVYDNGACIYDTMLASIFGGMTSQGKKVVTEMEEGSTPDKVVFAYHFEDVV